MEENKKSFNTMLTRANDAYMPLITKQLTERNIEFSEYSKKCVMNAIGTINGMLDKAGLSLNSPELDQSNLVSTLMQVAHLEVNSIAQPSECYFQLRKVKTATGQYKQQVEFGLMGDGHDAILARFGRDVQKVYPYWIVRAGDHFEYPQYNGVEYTPPKWQPTGQGDVVRIVYPILHTDKTIHYYIGEREDVLRNLLAHINNNLMNETFGIAENRYKATQEQIAKINKKKAALKEKAKQLGFGALDDEELSAYISPSWKEDFSRETMIIRKIRNNIVKKIPKDFGSPAVYESFNEATSESYSTAKRVIINDTASEEVAPIESLGGETSPQSQNDGANRGQAEPITIEAQEANNEPQGADVENRQRPNFD